MCSTKVDISKESLDSSKLPFNRKTFLAEQFLFYKILVGNKLRFTNSQSYEYIFGRNFVGNNLFDLNKGSFMFKKITFLFILNSFIFTQTLFFSEYAEGSSHNKYLEIFNGGNSAVDLSAYSLSSCSNGCDTNGEWDYPNNVTFDRRH